MDEVILALKAILEDELPANIFTEVYDGENLLPAQSSFPFVEVIAESEVQSERGTNSIDAEFTITIAIKDTLKAYLDQNTDRDTISYSKKMREWISSRDDNGILESDCILGILSNNLKITNTVQINRDRRVGYNEILPFDGSYVVRGFVTFTCHHIFHKT
jgi:type III secretory pathway component EscR